MLIVIDLGKTDEMRGRLRDQYCVSATTCPNTLSPTFWSPYYASSVTTSVWNADSAAYRSVDKWDLAYSWPATGDYVAPAGDDTAPSLWLNTITHTGYAADGVSNLADPAVSMGGVRMANRVDWAPSLGVVPMIHYRISSIGNGMGGQTLVSYDPNQCNQAASSGYDPAQNPNQCYPQPVTGGFGWYHKYRVHSVTLHDLTGASPTDEVWTYAYSTAGSSTNVLWHHDSTSETVSMDQRSYSQFRGYSTVTVTHGAAGGPQTVTKSLYYRGLDLDRTDAGWGTRRASVLMSPGAPSVAVPLYGYAGKCLDDANWGTADGNKIQLWPCTGDWNQVWQMQTNGTIMNPHTGKCLDVTGGGTAEGVLVQLFTCNGTPRQIWQVRSDGGLMNPASGNCLDVAGPSSTDGAQIHIWHCYAGPAQAWYSQIPDTDALNGQLAEQSTWDGSTNISDTITVPSAFGTASRAPVNPPNNTTLLANMVRVTETHARTWIAATGSWRWTGSHTTYDSYGNPTLVSNLGQEGLPDDDVCTTTSYAAPDTTKWLINFPSQTISTDCAATPVDADYLSGSQTFYDGSATFGATPSQGLSTKNTLLDKVVSGVRTWAPGSQTGYDSYGRVTSSMDARGYATTTAYTPTTGGPVTSTAVKNSKLWTTTTNLDPRGLPTSVVDVNAKTTSLSYDPLGRLTKVWLNNRATSGTPDLQYTYTTSSSAPNWVQTQKLGPTGAPDRLVPALRRGDASAADAVADPRRQRRSDDQRHDLRQSRPRRQDIGLL